MVAGNGEWPELDPHYPPGDGDFPSAWRRVVEVLDQIKGVVMGAQGEARRANMNSDLLLGQMKAFDSKIDGLVKVMTTSWPSGLPPMRPELDSTHAVLEKKASDSFSERLQKLATASPGPRDQLTASPEAIRKLADEVWAERAREAKHEADAKRLKEIDLATERSAKDLHALKMHGLKIIVGFVLLGLLGSGVAYWKGGRDKAPSSAPATK